MSKGRLNKPLTEAEHALVRERWLDGASATELAAELGCSRPTIYRSVRVVSGLPVDDAKKCERCGRWYRGACTGGHE